MTTTPPTDRPLTGLNVGIVGASVGGLSTARFLLERGATVQVFERSRSRLEERGGGIALDPEVVPLIGQFPHEVMGRRLVLGTDGRVLWEKELSKCTTAWFAIYRALQAQIAEDLIRRGSAVTRCQAQADGAVLELDGGTTARFDLVIGADGVGSVVREAVAPDFEPRYLGYVAVRGHIDVRELPAGSERLRAWADTPAIVNCYGPGTHVVAYWIPGIAGGRALNWMWYRNVGLGELAEFMSDGLGQTHHWSLPPGQVTESRRDQLLRELETLFPPEFSRVARATGNISLQAIFCGVPDHFVRGRVVLVGDAAHVAVPHIGAGSSFAIQDARALADTLDPARLGESLDTWEQARRAATIVNLDAAVRLGQALQHEAHAWSNWTPPDFEAWWKTIVAGSSLYFDRPGR